MRWAEGFIAVDWGTTNRRAYLLDGERRHAGEFEDAKGVLSVARDGFPAAVAEIRERLGDLPLLMAGMIGSNRGWVEAPYVPCPAGLDQLAGSLVWVDERCAIVPGVSYLDRDRADVMRGEEVQLLGALAQGLVPPDCLVCHPGTHNKWARLERGSIVEFRTVMTGELFSLLKAHSILSDLLREEAEPGEAFRRGVRAALDGADLQSELFAVRARTILGASPRQDACAYTSGLLIGGDVRIGTRNGTGGEVIVMGRPELTRLYSAALAEAGRPAREIDGEDSFLAGILAIAERMT